MSKFSALVVINKQIKKVWTSNEEVIKLLESKEVDNVYRTGNDQLALLTDAGQVVWIDVSYEELKKDK